MSVGLMPCSIRVTTIKKPNQNQLSLNFDTHHGQDEQRAHEIKRARNILAYVDRIHECLNDMYEHLVDREYQDFSDELETAIEYLEHLRENADKKF